MNLRITVSGPVAEGSLEKNKRPSLEGWVKAERSEETWWRTGVDDSGFVGGSVVCVWMA